MTEMLRILPYNSVTFDKGIVIGDAYDVRVTYEINGERRLDFSYPINEKSEIISENKIKAAACMLPLSDDKSISKGLGTRHRSAAGMSQESDAIEVVVSEETGKISVAKDGTLIVDVKEDALRQILIKNIVTKKFGEEVPKKKLKEKIEEIKEKTGKKENEKHKTNNRI